MLRQSTLQFITSLYYIPHRQLIKQMAASFSIASPEQSLSEHSKFDETATKSEAVGSAARTREGEDNTAEASGSQQDKGAGNNRSKQLAAVILVLVLSIFFVHVTSPLAR